MSNGENFGGFARDKGRNSKGSKSKKKHFKVGEQGGEVLKNIDENNLVMCMFRDIGKELDSKHDRYERIVKISRDVTIESKRIIFSLHSLSASTEEKKEESLKDIESRLKNLKSKCLRPIALELNNLDSFQYHKAYGGGIEEFIEAILFYKYTKSGNIVTYENIYEEFFTFPIKFDDEDGELLSLLFTHTDFVLGMADFTGELMRKSINSLSCGQLEECYKTLALCREIQVGFMGLCFSGMKSITRKYHTLSQSISKMEQVCYTLAVRGNEIHTGSLIDAISCDKTQNDNEDLDEGIF